MSRTNASFIFEKKDLSIFFSYAHQDEAYRDKLEQHLSFLKRTAPLAPWYDRKITAGDDWAGKIDEQLNLADIILLLISPDFANSDYCWDVETKRALERSDKGEALVIPIVIRPVEGWHVTPIGQLQALPKNGQPVSTWRNRDMAYENIAQGLRHAIENWSGGNTSAKGDWVGWRLKLEGELEGYSEQRIHSITSRLRKSVNTDKLEYIASSIGSAILEFRSTQSVLDALKSLHTNGLLEEKIECSILDLNSNLGAALRIESQIVDNEYHSSIRYLPEIFGGCTLEESFPPLLSGITFPLNNPMQMGFSLLSDASSGTLSQEEQAQLQARLGRYLNTFLVLSGDQINVTLTPTDDFCGLPKLLRNTELGRDMLAQDVVLKHYAASLLHPSTPQGSAFWREADLITTGPHNFESCFRVWIVPDDATVYEKSENDHGHVTIEKLGLKVLCEVDYDTLHKFREQRGENTSFSDVQPSSDAQQKGEQLVTLFKKLIVPEIQKEVSAGSQFGLLRQILSVLVISKWIMESQLGEALKQAGFLASNNPKKYGLSTVDDAVLLSMKQLYLNMFRDGVWQHTRTRVDIKKGVVEKRLYVAGGIVVAGITRCDRIGCYQQPILFANIQV